MYRVSTEKRNKEYSCIIGFMRVRFLFGIRRKPNSAGTVGVTWAKAKLTDRQGHTHSV